MEFPKKFYNDQMCRSFLFDIKWKNGFLCIKCGNKKGYVRKNYRYQCASCNHIESSTANTLFHKVKFGLQKALHIAYDMVSCDKKLSSTYISKKYQIRQATAWFFMQKIRSAMQACKNTSIEDIVHTERFKIQKSNHTASIKVEFGKNFRFNQITVNDHTDTQRQAAKELETACSCKIAACRSTMEKLSLWLNTVSKKTTKHLQEYVNEFSYKLNHSDNKENIFNCLITKMTKHRPLFHKAIIR